MAFWDNVNPESLLSTPGNYASKGQKEMAEAMMKSLDKSSQPQPIRHWSQGVAQMIAALGEGGWQNVASNLNNRAAYDAGAKTSQYVAPTGDASQAPGNPTTTGSTGPSADAGSVSPMGTGALSGDPDKAKDYIFKTARNESGGNVNAPATGSNRGLGQFSPDLEARYGINDSNRTDRATQERAILRHAQDNAAVFRQRLNREPDDAELYLSHQQGAAGGPALIAAGGLPAWRAIKGFYPNEGIAKQAIYGNMNSKDSLSQRQADQISAQDFVDYQRGRYHYGPSYRTGMALPPRAMPQDNAPPVAGETVSDAREPVQSHVAGISTGNEPAQEPASEPMKPLGYHASVKTQDIPGISKLGKGDGSEADRDEQQELKNAQVAQNAPGLATRSQADIPNTQQSGAYRGNMPYTGYVATPQHLKELLTSPLIAEDPELKMRIMENYQKRTEPQDRQTAGGIVQTAPGYGNKSKSQFLPMGPGSPFSMGAGGASIHGQMHPVVGQDGNVTYQGNFPGGPAGASPQGTGSPTTGGDMLGGAGDLMKQLQKVGRTGEEQGKMLSGVGAQRQKLIEDAQGSTTNINHLNAVQGISELLPVDRSPTAENVIKAKQIIKEHFPDLWKSWGGDAEGLKGSELLQKFNAYSASEATRNLSTRGPVFDFQTFMKTLPGNIQSKEGTGALVNVLRQEEEAKREIALKVGALKAEDMDNNPNIVSDIRNQYYKDHPIKLQMGGQTFHAQVYNKEEADKNVKKGEYFLRKDENTNEGKLMRKNN